jgi:hypothetical protein
MITMHLTANAETIDRLVNQGALLLEAFHAEHENGPTGCEAEFLRGEFSGWRSTLHTEYHDCAEEIVNRVLTRTGLRIPSGEIGARGARSS